MENVNLTCDLSVAARQPKTYHVKKVCKVAEMPKNARYHDTIYLFNKSCQDIYRTDSGIFYATNQRF